MFFLATETSCNDKNMTAATGTISSPGYPKKYTDDLDCTSTITVAPGKRILLNFTAFDVEASYGGCLYDYLQIVDGSRSRKFCGNGAQRLRSYKSKTNKLTLRFKTDSTTTRTGYHATYTAVDGKCVTCTLSPGKGHSGKTRYFSKLDRPLKQ